ncbi:hypothetical protein PUNSTDRAFT_61166 [Punctularia strigosozonata HHB-11173 SS5]|uniref:uncharacterized protein n=1 Tax=Punctularia strigosozonata (strain HHB-11173) TaxID=741275 RepID=UPI00044174E3|nr:uncharacterized protein PUNSTDRAFT_61166 [Punctularia strigosozonata HHB-11173 SS5]EIN12767.1 hypothetical protein PUNSTDRAFT_61166 [Punctularia strigosozonata HHB-11173 SS5]
MDVPLTPPPRIKPISAKPVSVYEAQHNIEAFVSDFQARGAASNTANTAVTVQLEKLARALQQKQ